MRLNQITALRLVQRQPGILITIPMLIAGGILLGQHANLSDLQLPGFDPYPKFQLQQKACSIRPGINPSPDTLIIDLLLCNTGSKIVPEAWVRLDSSSFTVGGDTLPFCNVVRKVRVGGAVRMDSLRYGDVSSGSCDNPDDPRDRFEFCIPRLQQAGMFIELSLMTTVTYGNGLRATRPFTVKARRPQQDVIVAL